MQISTLRERVRASALDFAWDSWAQMGVFAEPRYEDRRAADPEALLVFTLQVARSDPRLFDEVLDWLRLNERLVSVQRLRNLCRDERDRRLVDASLRWVSRFRRNPRFGAEGTKSPPAEGEPLFGTSVSDVWNPDPQFLELGFVRPVAEPSLKSRRPDVSLPVNFAFRTRLVFGVGSRAEILRYLLTAPAPDVSAQLVTEAVTFDKSNVSGTLNALVEAGLVSAFTVGNERRYSIDRAAWARLLGLAPDGLPAHRDWPQLLWTHREILRWLEDPSLEDLSDYLLASAARDLIGRLEKTLLFAGVPVYGTTLPGERYWEGFVETVNAAIEALTH